MGSANGMIILLGFDGSAKRIDLLTFFVAWKETGQEPGIEIAQYVKLEELNAQELKIARASKLYPVAEITDNLERIVMEHEMTIKEANAKVLNLDLMIKENGALLSVKDGRIAKLEGRILKLTCDDCKNGLPCAKVESCNDCNYCSMGRTCCMGIHGNGK